MEHDKGITLRETHPRDLPEIFEMEQRCYPDPWEFDAFVESYFENQVCWSAEYEGRLAGYMIAIRMNDCYHLANLAVDHDFRRKGIGRMFLRMLDSLADAESISRIKLEVRRSNLAAIALYKSERYQEAGHCKRYYLDKEDALIFIKELAGRQDRFDSVVDSTETAFKTNTEKSDKLI